MRMIIISILPIVYGIMLILDTFISYRVKGFSIESKFAILMQILVVLYPGSLLVGFSMTFFILYNLAWVVIAILLKVYTIGFRISLKTASRNVVEDKLKEVLDKNNIKYVLNDSAYRYELKTDKRFVSIKIENGTFNEQNRYISFKGWTDYKKYKEISRQLIDGLKPYAINRRINIDIIMCLIISIGMISFGVWLLISKGLI